MRRLESVSTATLETMDELADWIYSSNTGRRRRRGRRAQEAPGRNGYVIMTACLIACAFAVEFWERFCAVIERHGRFVDVTAIWDAACTFRR